MNSNYVLHWVITELGGMDHINHRAFKQILSNSAETWKFHSKAQIPQLVSKFRGPWKTAGP